MNLLDLVKGHISNKVVSSLGGLLGESDEQTQSAVSNALPSIIGGLMSKASTQDGARSLASALDDDKDDGLLDDIAGFLGSGNHQSVLDKGNGILGSLFGGGLGNVTDIISKASGMGRASSGSLLGLIAPMVMSALGRHKRSSGLDASGLADLLRSQGPNIASSLPSGLADSLGIGNILSGGGSSESHEAQGSVASHATEAAGDAGHAVAGAAGNAAGAVRDTAGAVGSAAGNVGGRAVETVGSAGRSGGSILGKFLPLLLLGLLGWLALKFLGGAKDGAVEGDLSGGGVAVEEQMIGADATDAEIDAAPAARAVEGASMDMPAMPSFDLDGLRGIFGNVTDSLGSVTDAASAEAALPALEQADNGLGGILTAIPDGMMGSVKDIIGNVLPGIQQQADRVGGLGGGVDGIIGNVIRSIIGRLIGFGG